MGSEPTPTTDWQNPPITRERFRDCLTIQFHLEPIYGVILQGGSNGVAIVPAATMEAALNLISEMLKDGELYDWGTSRYPSGQVVHFYDVVKSRMELCHAP